METITGKARISGFHFDRFFRIVAANKRAMLKIKPRFDVEKRVALNSIICESCGVSCHPSETKNGHCRDCREVESQEKIERALPFGLTVEDLAGAEQV